MALKAEIDGILQEIESLHGAILSATEFLTDGTIITKSLAKSRFAYIQPLWANLRTLHCQLLAESDDNLKSKLPYFTNNEFRSAERHMLFALDTLQRYMDEEASTSSRATATTETAAEKRHVLQVPRITLPRFSGSLKDWPTFKDYFVSLIHNDQSFDDLQKLHYLKSCLDGEAGNVIRNVPVLASNFKLASDLLLSPYDNTRVLILQHLSNLFTLPPVSLESAKDLQNLVDSVRESLQSLKNLKRSVHTWDDMIVFLIVSRLEKATRQSWELSLDSSCEFPSLETLFSFLISRIRAFSSASSVVVNSSSISHNRTTLVKPNRVNLHFNNTSTVLCTLCKGNHVIYRCSKLLQNNADQRLVLVKQNHLCINCLSSEHILRDCKSTKNCHRCGTRHHTLLHKPPLGIADSLEIKESKTTADPAKLKSVTSLSLSPTNVSSHFSANIHKSDVVLATAWVLVSGPSRSARVRALLDQGSTHTLATSSLIKALDVKPSPINALLCGIGDTAAGKVNRAVSLTIAPLRNQGPSLTTNALVLPSLTSYVPRFRFPVDHWPHIRGLQLADEEPHSDAPIHLIIGADLYGYALLKGIRQGGFGQPVARGFRLTEFYGH